MSASMELAGEICQAAPLAVKAAKEVIIRSYDMPMEEGRELVRSLSILLRSSEDFKEGTRAFMERRKPNYQGK